MALDAKGIAKVAMRRHELPLFHLGGELKLLHELSVKIGQVIERAFLPGSLDKLRRVFQHACQGFDAFIKRYDQQPTAGQDDLAVPKLKKNIGKQQDKDGTGS